jgi:demethylmenaquinone methyltransferase / 2-methoxy-6-polyprenyl-1,4-benzoquinol methylase
MRTHDPDAPTERTRHARQLFAGLPRNYDFMAAVLSLGQEARWRRALTSCIPLEADLVLDVASGTGAVTIDLLRTRPGTIVVAVDQSEPMLRRGLVRTHAAGVGDRTASALAQAEWLPFASDRFDALTFTYLMRYVDDPAATIRELTRVVRPGGVVANLEFHVPGNPIWHAAWLFYTRMVMPIEGALASRHWYRVGRFLGPSISLLYRRFPLGTQLRMWRDAGLHPVRYRVMSLGGAVVIYGVKQGE